MCVCSTYWLQFRLEKSRKTLGFLCLKCGNLVYGHHDSKHAIFCAYILHMCLPGVPSSYVHGSIIDGIFSGRIDLLQETYYVDKTEIYFSDPQPFHSVIYAGSDVTHDLPSRSVATFLVMCRGKIVALLNLATSLYFINQPICDFFISRDFTCVSGCCIACLEFPSNFAQLGKSSHCLRSAGN